MCQKGTRVQASPENVHAMSTRVCSRLGVRTRLIYQCCELGPWVEVTKGRRGVRRMLSTEPHLKERKRQRSTE